MVTKRIQIGDGYGYVEYHQDWCPMYGGLLYTQDPDSPCGDYPMCFRCNLFYSIRYQEPETLISIFGREKYD